MNTWWLLLGMTTITFYNRYAFFFKGLQYQPGPNIRRLLSYSIYAILTAIWAPIIFSFDSTSAGFTHAGWDYIIGASLAGLLSMLRVPGIIVVIVCAIVFFGIRFFL